MMKRIKATLTTILTFVIMTVLADEPCKKCDINKVIIVSEHLDSLTYKMVDAFLSTFDKSCKTNVEFSEFGNEMLYKVLGKYTELYFQIITNENVNNKALLIEIENPIFDLDLQDIYEKVKCSSAPPGLKTKYLDAIFKAGMKNNQLINRRMCHG